MRAVVLDLECFYDPKNLRGDKKPDGSPDPYTIRAMTTESYCRDPRFDIHGAAIKWSASTSAVWYDARELAYVMKEEDWSDVFMINHHANFDQLVLSHQYKVVPAMSGCTMSMARLLLGNHIGVSLDSVRAQFGFPPKSTPYNLFEGKYWKDMDPYVRQQVAAGACDEVESIWKLFGMLMQRGFPVEELDVVDSTIKMFTVPELIGDAAVFAKVWVDESTRKTAALERLGVTAKDLGSDEVFASLLRARGVEPETKTTDKGNTKFAFAKTDSQMEELLNDEDDEVRALAEARLGTKSTLLQTRAATLGWMASRGSLCVYLRYCGAHTSRWSGGDDTNFQNWTNGSEINSAVVAPDGYLIAEPDASQIECRLLNFCAGQKDKIEEFRSGADPYIGVASAFYKKPINKKDHPDERQLGKIVELQAGYGSGGNKIRSTVRVKSGGKILLTPAQGVEARDAYRSTHPRVVTYWRQAENHLGAMGQFKSGDWGPFRIKCDAAAGTRRIVLPNGIEIIYDTLNYYSDPETGDQYWRLKTRKGWVKTYGAKLVENCLSATVKVLTHKGWKPITGVQKNDRLWDGVEWVRHEGVVSKGVQETGFLDGVRMTADHKVLTKNGWVRAAQAQGYQRASVQFPDGYPRCWFHREKAFMALSVRLRERNNDNWRPIHVGSLPKLRVPQGRIDSPVSHHARAEQASTVRGLGFDACSMPSKIALCLRALRRSRNNSLQALANQFSEFLGRHVPDLQAGTHSRKTEKQQGVFTNQLHMGGSPPASEKPTKQPADRYEVGKNNSIRSRPTFGHWGLYPSLSDSKQLASEPLVHQGRFYEPTFDILNCGPRNRFVVMGDGGPFIVHNCIQALARVVVSQAMLRLKKLGYRCKNTKHDSLWLLVPKGDGRLEEHKATILAEMSRTPTWLPGVPLAAEFKGIDSRMTW